MSRPVDFTLYKDKVYLELCLDMIEDAYLYSRSRHYDLLEQQLKDILETFDHFKKSGQQQVPENETNSVVPFKK